MDSGTLIKIIKTKIPTPNYAAPVSSVIIIAESLKLDYITPNYLIEQVLVP